MDIVFSPSGFVDVFNQTLEYAYPTAVLQGELSNFKVAKNRWVYFDLKDDSATLRCFGTVYMLPGPLEDGMLVQIVCSPRLHPLYNFSLNVSSITPVGEGALAKQAELLYKKLEAEGLFALERKRPIVFAPEHIALVGSPESAAYADFVKIAKARWPFCKIDVYSSLVQGSEAPSQISTAVQAINHASTLYDALVLIRGGGSAEDLSAFNDERVVRALVASRIPTAVAIGHEVNESLAELCADLHASTPSNLAELLLPDVSSEIASYNAQKKFCNQVVGAAINESRATLREYRSTIMHYLETLISSEKQFAVTMQALIDALNPRVILQRGYAVVHHKAAVVRSVQQVETGDRIVVTLFDGSISAEVI